MKRVACLSILFLSMILVVPPAFAQSYGGYPTYQQGYQPCPGLVNPQDMNCGYQPYTAHQPQTQQFNQMITPTQVPVQAQQQQNQPRDPYFSNNNNYQAQQPPAGNQFAPQNMSAYQQQEQAINQSQLAQELEELKSKKESEESFRLGSEINSNDGQGFDDSGSKKAKFKGAASSMGKLVKGTVKYAAPAAGTVGGLFLMRAILGRGPMMMPMGGGGMMYMPY